MGRPPIGKRAMTDAERQRRRRDRPGMITERISDLISDLKRYNRAIPKISAKIEKLGPRLTAEDTEYLVELALSLANRATELASIARRVQRVRRGQP
jgi:hypothetical protein